MKNKLTLALLVLLTAFASCSFRSNSFENNDKDKLLLELISFVLEKWHFSPETIDDQFSEKVYEDFINDLDPLKRVFLESDLKDFEVYRYQIDDELKNLNLDFFNLVYDRYMKRLKESQDLYKEVLSQPFDFSIEESVIVDYDQIEAVSSKAELKERWRKQLKYSALGNYFAKWETQQEQLEEDSSAKVKTEAELEQESRDQLMTTLDDNYAFYFNDLERKDWFVQYLNSIVETYDPHTFYFAPEDKEKFDIDMSGKYEGIGARLSKRRDQTKIVEIISGGPVWRDKSLEVGDEIQKVGQEGEEEPVNIVGMRLDDAIKLIKGPKGTKVFLHVKRVDGKKEVVPIMRDAIELEETYAKSAKVEKDGVPYGIIHLPKFYVNFTDYDTRNAATDIAKEIAELKSEGVEGLVIDLRNNGGGSLQTVVDIAGLFIKEGPVVQVKNSDYEIDVFEDEDPTIQWDGPLVLLVNELSASASEILAAALQDYERAVVIGSERTFGKGTVQNMIPFDRLVRNSDYGALGALKITTQKYYRVNGGSTQLKGVNSDVVVPDRYSYMEIGEREQDYPMPWDKIASADFEPWVGYMDLEKTIERSQKRMKDNTYLKLIDENAKWIKEQQDRSSSTLSFESYKKMIEDADQKAKYFESINDFDSHLTFESLQYEDELFVKDETLREKRNRWHESLAKDIYVDEALNVLKDLKFKFTNPKKMIGLSKQLD